MKTKNGIKIFCCGGAGINIGQAIEQSVESENFASIELVFVDTSVSNMREGKRDNVYIIKGRKGDVDGSGQIRREHADSIKEQVPAILLEHKPGDLNIILSSASGGSGSTVGPMLAVELLKRGERVIVFLVGSKETDRYTENTLNTLLSYEGISRVSGRPVAMYYEENNAQTTRQVVDKRILGTIVILRSLFSGQNHELDSMDLNNWLNYDRVTSYKPRLVSLEVIGRETAVKAGTNYISVATLTTPEQATQIDGLIPEYQCVGFVPNNTSQAIIERLPVHLVLTENGPSEIVESLRGTLDALNERKVARTQVSSLFDSNDVTIEDNGLVL